MSSVTVDLTKFKALEGVTSQRSPEMIRFKKTAASDYRGFLLDRFKRFSAGGGNWPRGVKKRGKILVDTGTLRRSLTKRYSGKPGQYQKLTGNKIIVAIRGGKHPKAKISVGRLAEIHNDGEGRMPKRQIIVRPNSELLAKWRDDIKAIPKRSWKTGKRKK